MLNRNWTQQGVVFETANGALEDFTVQFDAALPRERGYVAHFTAGPTLQDQRLYRVDGPSPRGPWTRPARVTPGHGQHTRLYRGGIFDGPLATRGVALISAVWPGLPKAGIWRFEGIVPGVIEKRLLLGPGPAGSGYDVAAVNPCVAWTGDHYTILFEGRGPLEAVKREPGGDPCGWQLFQASWNGVDDARVDPEPLWAGGNPSLVRFESGWHLYWSRWNAQKGGFDSCLATL